MRHLLSNLNILSLAELLQMFFTRILPNASLFKAKLFGSRFLRGVFLEKSSGSKCIPKNTRHKKLAHTLCLLLITGFSNFALAECDDYKSKQLADEGSIAFLGKGTEIFQQATVLKRHHPSHQKEVASYAKAGGRYYTMFFIINNDCKAFFIKRAGPR